MKPIKASTIIQKLLLVICILPISFAALSQNIYDSIYVGNRWRTYMTHLPVGYNQTKKYPLVFCFHGGQANNASLGWSAIAFQSKLSQKSDSAGFIVVYPEGTVFNNNRSWNAGKCCPPAMNQNIDDVGFVNYLLNELLKSYSIDSLSVYATGSSNGGMLCYRLACELSERFAAIAPNACSQMFFPCNPTRKVPIIHFHSYADNEVPYNGGTGTGPSGVSMTSQDSTMKIWRALNNCQSVDTIVNGKGLNYDFIKIHNCSCKVEYHHYSTTDGGHSWPGGNPNNNPASKQINATDLLWEFFKQYKLGCLNTGVGEAETHSEVLSVFPNPTNGVVYFSKSNNAMPFKLIDATGKTIYFGNSNSLDLSEITPGVYYLLIETENGVTRKKIIKNP